MPFAILGLLLAEPLSLDYLHKRFSAGISLFYRASFGAIRRALGALHAHRAIYRWQPVTVDYGLRSHALALTCLAELEASA